MEEKKCCISIRIKLLIHGDDWWCDHCDLVDNNVTLSPQLSYSLLFNKIIKNNKEKMQLLFYAILNLKDWTKDLLMVRLNLKFPKMVYYSL